MTVQRSALGLVASVLALLSSGACSSSMSGPPLPNQSTPCATKAAGGALCIKILSDKGTIGDVFGYLASSESPLAGTHWRLVLNSYHCDPGTSATASCAPVDTYPGPTRHGVPPINSYCRSDGTTDTTSAGCHNTLASETGTHGDWSGLTLADHGLTVRQKTWLCVSEQVRSSRGWVEAPSEPAPRRACSAVAPG